ncbi:hypothetical protein [Paraburkholderia fungorum]|uniref:hypothetical protein n=1 Tax=Paraburkholderia fungorum TaxID=134537 RepID=UPI0011C42763|nr:hypothetical protein [Paraburkholderia fungorum]
MQLEDMLGDIHADDVRLHLETSSVSRCVRVFDGSTVQLTTSEAVLCHCAPALPVAGGVDTI